MEEQLIICDEHGCDLRSASRSVVHEQGLWHKVVHLWIYDDQHLYVQQRAFTKKAFPGAYDISVAGHQNPQETAIISVVREGKEELGFLIDPSQIVYIGTYQEAIQHDSLWDKEVASVYLCGMDISFFEPSEEVMALGRIPLVEMEDLLSNKQTVCHFNNIQTQEIRQLNKAEVFIHEEAYYSWILSEIKRIQENSPSQVG